MSKKSKLKKQIKETELVIEAFEQERERLLSAVADEKVQSSEQNQLNVEYIKVFTTLIEEKRVYLEQCKTALNPQKK